MNEDMDEPISSQDLILSQESYQFLWESMKLPNGPILEFDNTDFCADADVKPSITTIDLTHAICLPVVTQSLASSTSAYSLPASIPANQNWPGEYEFKVFFEAQEKSTKGITWTYSDEKDKLYVGKDVACPINFSVNQIIPDGMRIRTQVTFSAPEYASEAVSRCMSHYHEDLQKGVKDPQHLVRCESAMASFETDLITKHNSVVVPFENPAAGQHFSTYIFKFTCFGSCMGGPNRRPLSLIFTLENRSGVAVGRQKLEIKICACPGRDKKIEEKSGKEAEDKPSVKRKHTDIFSDISETLNFVSDAFPSKKTKISTNPSGPYNIRAKDKDMYDFLVQMKKLYKMHRAFQGLSPDAKKAISKIVHRTNIGNDSDSS